MNERMWLNDAPMEAEGCVREPCVSRLMLCIASLGLAMRCFVTLCLKIWLAEECGQCHVQGVAVRVTRNMENIVEGLVGLPLDQQP